MPRTLSLKKKITFTFVSFFCFYAVLEVIASTIAWASWWDTSLWLFEDSGRTLRFDPIHGYRLTGTPSRFLRKTNGMLEYVGTVRGNSEGFADRDDFGPKRSRTGVPRIAVFGDSFTAGQNLGQNWPDRAEDVSRERGKPVELLNFAVSGGGLANWWSTLTRDVEPKGYEIDGVIFAVFAGDLRRKFTVSDHRGTQPLFARVSSWSPESYPSTLEDARKIMTPQPGQILSPEEFELSLQGRWPKGVSRRFRPFLLTLAWRSLRGSKPAGVEEIGSDRDPTRQRLISEIARILANRRIPSLVVHIPDRSTLLDPQGSPRWPKEDAIEFAGAIGATFVDGERLFSGLTPREIRALFLPYDGHWNESGSNRFANFILQETPWLEEAQTGHQEGRR